MTGPRRPEGTNGWAIAAFVLGILGGTILSVIFAIVALFQTMDRRQRGRGLAIAALVISAAWIAVITSLIAYGLSAQGKSVQAVDLKTGDCVKDASESELPTWVKRVRCDRPHYGEAFAVLTLSGTPTYPVGKPCGPAATSAGPRSSTTPRTRRRDRRSALRWHTRRPTVGQTANGPSFASRCRNMSGGHRCATDATLTCSPGW
ncbi:MAG TPA: DUF4190 domain-containing protein [Mycobacterium sp.]